MNKKAEEQGWSISTICELLRDWMCFEFILEVKRRMADVEAKNYISMFLKTLAPVMVYEVAESLEKLGIMKKDDFFNPGMKKKVQLEREKSIKKIIVKSSQPQLIEQDMGLDFDSKVYDINILVKDNRLLDMNYEIFNENISEDFEFWDSLFRLPRNMLNALLSVLHIQMNIDDMYSKMENEMDEIVTKIENEFSCERYSYSVNKLFSVNTQLEDIDKIFILYRYRMITSADKLEKVMPDFKMSIERVDIVDFKTFFRKYKAIIICIIGDELRNMDTLFAENIKDDIQNKVDNEDFWSVNRKLRNNIHYVKTEVMTNEELEMIDRYQTVYIDVLKEHLEKNIYIDIDKECKTMTGFLKSCQDKGMSKEDIDKYYFYYYVKYLIFGKV